MWPFKTKPKEISIEYIIKEFNVPANKSHLINLHTDQELSEKTIKKIREYFNKEFIRNKIDSPIIITYSGFSIKVHKIKNDQPNTE